MRLKGYQVDVLHASAQVAMPGGHRINLIDELCKPAFLHPCCHRRCSLLFASNKAEPVTALCQATSDEAGSPTPSCSPQWLRDRSHIEQPLGMPWSVEASRGRSLRSMLRSPLGSDQIIKATPYQKHTRDLAKESGSLNRPSVAWPRPRRHSSPHELSLQETAWSWPPPPSHIFFHRGFS